MGGLALDGRKDGFCAFGGRKVAKPAGLQQGRGFFGDERGQAATEYLLLVAVGLAILVVAVSLVLQLRGISDTVANHVRSERAEAIAMLVR